MACRCDQEYAAGPVIEAFARFGLDWGGHGNESLDFQHFRQNGR